MAYRLRMRYAVAIISFFGFILNHSLKNVTNVTLVAMTEGAHHADHQHTHKYNQPTNGTAEISTSSSNDSPDDHLIHWDPQTRNSIQSAFFFGYIVLQLPAGRIAELVGSRHIFGPAILCSSLLGTLFPLAARSGVFWTKLVRGLQGLCLGVTFPCMHGLLSQWAPITERSLMVTSVFAGGPMGIVVVEILSGYLSGLTWMDGWPLVYYAIGIFGAIWYVFWYIYVYNSPETHPMITKEELREINEGRNKSNKNKKEPLPWLKMLGTIEIYAIIVAHTTFAWTMYVTVIQEPNYMSGVLGVDIEENGLLSSLPHLAFALSSICFGYICDYLRKTGRLSVTKLRKIFNTIGAIGPAICYIIIPHLGHGKVMVNILFVVAMVLSSSTVTGSSTNHVDLSPTFAGTLMGVSNFFSNIPGVLVSEAHSLMVGESKEIKDWSYLFYLTSLIGLFGGMFYAIFASSKIQPWDPESEAHQSDYNQNEINKQPSSELPKQIVFNVDENRARF
ncbi:vesicular glutamate transporter 3-like [Brevipalpus obovatus]|uniref:vesicular glutamate transporter 3-like n=1 Tax=Brevipalpus obovatus TaxID=246614 RepID=UPI003D9F2A3F